jgi:hypothetical protein
MATEAQEIKERQEAANVVQSHVRRRSAKKLVVEMKAEKAKETQAVTTLQSFARRRKPKLVDGVGDESEQAEEATELSSPAVHGGTKKQVPLMQEGKKLGNGENKSDQVVGDTHLGDNCMIVATGAAGAERKHNTSKCKAPHRALMELTHPIVLLAHQSTRSSYPLYYELATIISRATSQRSFPAPELLLIGLMYQGVCQSSTSLIAHTTSNDARAAAYVAFIAIPVGYLFFVCYVCVYQVWWRGRAIRKGGRGSEQRKKQLTTIRPHLPSIQNERRVSKGLPVEQNHASMQLPVKAVELMGALGSMDQDEGDSHPMSHTQTHGGSLADGGFKGPMLAGDGVYEEHFASNHHHQREDMVVR